MREYCKSLGLQHAILGDEDMKTHIIMVYNALLTCHSLQTLACCVPLAVFEEEIATTFYLAGTEGLEPGPILATLKQLRLQHLSFAQVTRAPPVDGLAALQEWFDSRSEQNKIVLKDSACKATSAKSRPAEVAGRWRRAMFVETKVAIKLVERSADGEEVKGEFDLVVSWRLLLWHRVKWAQYESTRCGLRRLMRVATLQSTRTQRLRFYVQRAICGAPPPQASTCTSLCLTIQRNRPSSLSS
eukprot:m.27861 g.27861  ORF g.27861 m.27861 type:complete len:243 (-) comp11781_c0_seq3:1378-2106(-)